MVCCVNKYDISMTRKVPGADADGKEKSGTLIKVFPIRAVTDGISRVRHRDNKVPMATAAPTTSRS
jgi:hypothetical protein